MRYKDTGLMNRICDFVGEYYRQEHESPSVAMIANALGIGKTTAYSYLVEMNEKGMLKYNGQQITTAKTRKSQTGYFSAPLVGTIRCGDPESEEENVEQYVSLPESLFGTGASYLLRASGDSMVDAGIADGDLVLIRKQESCEVGDIVVALDAENENTLKRYVGTDPENGCAILKYENEKRYPGRVIRVKRLTVQGVAKFVFKSL